LRKGEHLKAAKIGKFLKQDDTHIQDLAVLAFKELFIKEGCVSPALIEHGREILENYTVNGEKTNAAIFELVKYFNSGVRDGAEFAEQLIRAFHVDSEIIGNAEDITEITLLLRP
jgi:hypothetical protein